LRIFLALAGLVLVLLLAARLRQGARPADAAPDAVRKVLDEQAKAWNMGDLDGFMAGYWQDQDAPDQKLTFFSSKGETSGWQATYDRYRREYQAEGKKTMGTLAFQNVRIEILSPEAAFVRGRWELTFTDKEPMGGLFTLIFQKKPQGWCIVHDHTSKDDRKPQ
jgi:beta-aspartyl-peptidase (threonine type)